VALVRIRNFIYFWIISATGHQAVRRVARCDLHDARDVTRRSLNFILL
jgi:hypothetical protein